MAEETKLVTKFGLPEKVAYCSRCVISNQRPSSYPELKHTKKRVTPTIHFDEDGVCDACRYAEEKKNIDWKAREEALEKLLDKHRSKDGSYDCVVPGSGGKDSCIAAHILKYRYGMTPLTVTFPPIMYTDYGWKNFQAWLDVGGFDNISYKPNGRIQRLLTRLSTINLMHPFQTFILGQKNLPPRIACQFKIPLIFYGESEAEYGNPIAENQSSLRDKSYYTMKHYDECFFGGVSVKELEEKYNCTRSDLTPYLPPDPKMLEENEIEVHYLGYYMKWTPQEAYYYSVEHCGFEARPIRSQGTYSKYASLDDKIDDLNFYTIHMKFGIGRATYDAAQEIRNKHLTREEGIALVKRFDGEFPDRYFDDIMEYLGLTRDEFFDIAEKFRSPHLWRKDGDEWVLRHPIWEST